MQNQLLPRQFNLRHMERIPGTACHFVDPLAVPVDLRRARVSIAGIDIAVPRRFSTRCRWAG
jgi:hypothetical protein